MRFKGMDLNLLVAFEALMDTRNTARAGERLGLSQPAASAALARLRDYFQDDLLVVKGRRLYPTPLAEMLVPKVAACLREAETVLATSSHFDPGRAERRFRVISSDYVVAAVLAPLACDLARTAPGLSFQFGLTDERAVEQLRRAEVDLVINPSEYAVEGFPTEPLYEEHYVIAGRRDHPIFAQPITKAAVFAYGHIAVSVGSQRATTVGDRQLEQLGQSRLVEVVASSFAVLPWLLIGTDRLTLMHERLARTTAEHFDIAYARLPFEFAPLRQMAQYHATRAADQSVRWLIDQIRNEVAKTSGAPPVSASAGTSGDGGRKRPATAQR